VVVGAVMVSESSQEGLRVSDGCETGGVMLVSELLSNDRSKLLSLKLKRALVVDTGLWMAGEKFFKKSR
jgi:hypothetical protein